MLCYTWAIDFNLSFSNYFWQLSLMTSRIHLHTLHLLSTSQMIWHINNLLTTCRTLFRTQTKRGQKPWLNISSDLEKKIWNRNTETFCSLYLSVVFLVVSSRLIFQENLNTQAPPLLTVFLKEITGETTEGTEASLLWWCKKPQEKK